MIEVVALLLERRACVQVHGTNGQGTALHNAAQSNNGDLICGFVSASRDLNCSTESLDTMSLPTVMQNLHLDGSSFKVWTM